MLGLGRALGEPIAVTMIISWCRYALADQVLQRRQLIASLIALRS